MPFKSIVHNRQEERDKMLFGPIKQNKMSCEWQHYDVSNHSKTPHSLQTKENSNKAKADENLNDYKILKYISAII